MLSNCQVLVMRSLCFFLVFILCVFLQLAVSASISCLFFFALIRDFESKEFFFANSVILLIIIDFSTLFIVCSWSIDFEKCVITLFIFLSTMIFAFRNDLKWYSTSMHAWNMMVSLSIIVSRSIFSIRLRIWFVFDYRDQFSALGWLLSCRRWLTPSALDLLVNLLLKHVFEIHLDNIASSS